jgi:ribonuclease PH
MASAALSDRPESQGFFPAAGRRFLRRTGRALQNAKRGMSPVLTRRRREASEAWRAKAKRIFE